MKNLDLTQRSDPQDRLGFAIAARLLDASENIPNDISERLKAARMLALTKRNVAKLQVATAVTSSGGAATLQMGTDDRTLWNRIASLLPLFVLIAGLLAIAIHQDQKRARDLADVDVELLTDELPPAAYTDPGFAHFLSVNRNN